MSKHGFSIRKPVAIWNKGLKINFEDLFKALVKTVVDGVAGKWPDSAKDFADALVSIGLKDDPPQLAWLLIFRSLTRAMYDLIKESAGFVKIPANVKELLKEIHTCIDSLEKSEQTISSVFFDHPKGLLVLDEIRKPFSQLLQAYIGLSEPQAEVISTRLPSYFVSALCEEWQENAKKYVPLKEAVNTPFTKASEQEHRWFHYLAVLQKRIDEPIFEEPFGLRQLYIPLRAYYEEVDSDADEKGNNPKIVVKLEDEVDSWLRERDDHRYAVKIICGEPGRGKSVFTKRLAARLAEKDEPRVLFIPLHQLNYSVDLITGVGKFVQEQTCLSGNPNPLDPETGETNLLIIFDGLDEISIQGKVGYEIAEKFLDEVEKTVDHFNYSYGVKRCLQVLITARPLVVQPHKDFRKPKQVWYILPYFVRESDREEYRDSQNLLELDQRQQWWISYGKATGHEYSGMPEKLKQPRLIELTSEPLLNHIIAKSIDALDLSEGSNRNTLYWDLLRAVYARPWAGDPHRSVKGVIELETFVRYLEEIASKAWHRGGTFTQNDVSNLEKYLPEGFEVDADLAKRVLLAFYCSQVSGTKYGEKIFEFTHRSFVEYLAARRVVNTVKTIHERFRARKEDIESDWDEEKALELWAKLCSPHMMEVNMGQFVYDELRLRKSSDVSNWQDTLSKLISYIFLQGVVTDNLRISSRQISTLNSRNAEETLLAALNACAFVTERPSEIKWSSKYTFGWWLSKLQGQRLRDYYLLALHCLDYLDLHECDLSVRDLCLAELSHTNLNKADLTLTSLVKANLKEASLEEADLNNARCDFSDFEGANLSKANLERTNFRGANLCKANLSEANLGDANFKGANLSEANLKGAKIEGTIFDEANLEGAIWINGETYSKDSAGKYIPESTT
jgi:uncharacterized protein YjbI with pentapeptide repeats